MKKKLLIYTLAVAVGAVSGFAVEPTGKSMPQIDNQSLLTTIDANQLDMFVTNIGVFAYDKSASRGTNDGLYFPNNYPITDTHVIYDAGLWLGGLVDGNVRVSVAEYSQEYVPGPMSGGTFMDDNEDFRVYKIYKNMTDDADYVNWPYDQGAPYTLNDDNEMVPWIEDIGADQMTFCVFNDADPVVHGNDAGGTTPLGVEVQLTTFAFDRADPLGNVIFMKYKFINKGGNNIDSMYVSLWADPDLGGAGDDLVGCDPATGLGYTYNASNNDSQYGQRPPAVGFDFFQGPADNMDIDGDGDTDEPLSMTSFNKYINGTDPHTPLESYNYMKGLNSDGTDIIDEVTGMVTMYQVSGDPVTGSGWTDSDAADRRQMMSAGPFTMAPNDTAEVVAAVMVAQGTDRLSSITYLKYVDGFAQTAFDNVFQVPQPPASPNAMISCYDDEVVITWDNAAELEPGDYAFQGYNVYQGESVAGPWTRIATYDISDGVATIFDQVFDVNTGQVIYYPLYFGNDGGLNYSFDVDQDYLTWNGNQSLVNGHPYYYSVTAYSYDPNAVPNNMETSHQVMTAIPHLSVGYQLDEVSAPGEAEWLPVEGTCAPGNAHVVVDMVDPGEVLDETYQIHFENRVGDDGLYQVWHMLNSNGDSLQTSQTNFSGDYQYQIIDGLQVRVSNLAGLYDYDWINSDGNRWVSGVDWGGALFFGGIDYGYNFFGSELALDYLYPSVELVFDPTETSYCQTYRRDLGYPRGGIGTFPGSAWELDPCTGERLRRLNICYVENNDLDVDGDGIPDYVDADLLTWELLDNIVGGRQYVFIMDSDYTDDPESLYGNGDWDGDGVIDPNMDIDGNGSTTDYWDGEDDLGWGPAADVIYAWWPKLRGSHPWMEAPGSLLLTAGMPCRPGTDVYEFTSIAGGHQITEDDLDMIRVTPNPYYGHSSYETKSDLKVVKFRNLPASCTIRVFNLAGDRVKTLEYVDDGSQEISWDLLTDHDLPVASGVYVYHVDVPNVGEIHGKMAIFQEVERLKEL